MSLAEDRIYAAIKANASLVALLSSDDKLRVYPCVLAQADLLPSIVYQRVSTIPHNTLCGDTLTSRPRIQIDIYGQTYASARAVAVLVRTALRYICTFQNQIDLSEIERGIFRITQDFQLHEEL